MIRLLTGWILAIALLLPAPAPLARADDLAAADRRPRTPTWPPGPGRSATCCATAPPARRTAIRNAGQLIWSASTIKLAMVVDLLARTYAGQIALTGSDRALMQRDAALVGQRRRRHLVDALRRARPSGVQPQLPALRHDRPGPAARVQRHLPVLGLPEDHRQRPGPPDQLHPGPPEPDRHGHHRRRHAECRPRPAVGCVGCRTGHGAGQQERLVVGAGWLGDQFGGVRRAGSALHPGGDERARRRGRLRRGRGHHHPAGPLSYSPG